MNMMNENKHRFINAIVMILFIMGVFNIVNNIKYNIASRMREFGMLRAVGTTYMNPIFKIQYREYLAVIITNFVITIITTYLSSMNIRKTAVVDMIKSSE